MKRRTPWGLARLLVILVLAVALVSVMGMVAFAQGLDESAEKECYLVGDMNADGKFSQDDAIHLLYYTFYPDEFPLKQNGDVTGDAAIKQADAIELLYATFYGDWPEYERFGTAAHDFYDPAWSWTDTDGVISATVTLQCACGEGSHTLGAEDVTVTEGETLAATCTKAGSQAYIATVSDHDETFTATYTKSIAPAGHQAVSDGFDENQHYGLCACGEKLDAASHNWVEDGAASTATCQVAAVQNYKCSCGATKSEQLGFAEHAYQYVEDVLLEGETCRYAKYYACENCEETKLADEYDSHAYVATVTKEATCQEDGVKSYICTRCGAVEKTEKIEKGADKHIWDNGTEANGVITYSCTVSGCTETKTTVTTGDNGTVSKDAIQSADQLELGLEDGSATLEMDQDVKDSLDAEKEIQITVEAMDVAAAEEKLETALTPEQKEQIGENKVYDFNMSYTDGEKVEFGGEITVSLPYTLAEGEDVDAITVWYIAEDGSLEEKEATYSNGYVTFKTEHFSYYTVTRLTPAERCARYGHIWTEVSKAATCSDDGYTMEVCQRCAATQNREGIPALGHNYQKTVTAPTCERFGTTVETCDNCGHTKSSVTPALGHSMKLSDTVAATCDAAGEEIYACQNEGCQHTTKKALPQLTHEYHKDDTKTVAATCTTGGYDVHVCKFCGDEIKKNEKTPLGHSFNADNAVWTWAEDDSAATLTLTCDNDCGTDKVLEANVAVVKATCLGDGAVKASVYYNNKSYTDEKAGASATGHIAGKEWVVTESEHYHKCTGCKEKLDAATHDYGEGVVKVEPTCTEPGVMIYTCSVCGHEKEGQIAASGKHSFDNGEITKAPTCATKGTKHYTCTACGFAKDEVIPATGEHTYVNGTCSGCGKQETACNHYRVTQKPLDVSGLDICSGFEGYLYSCECGQRQYVYVENLTCDIRTISEYETEYGVVYIEECINCGLHAESGQDVRFNADPCRAELVEFGKLSLGDTVICDFTIVRDSAEHIPHVVKEETKISDKGICELTVRTVACDCGEVTQTYAEEDCDYQYGYGSPCTICGCVVDYEVSETVFDGCKVSEQWIYTYYNRDRDVVYTYTREDIWYEHSFEATDYEMYGDSCNDGVWVEYLCGECGEITEDYYEGGHPRVVREDTDLSDANICAVYHIQESCACGFRKYAELIYDEDYCQWAQIKDPNEAPATGDSYTEYYMCSVCGAQQTVEIIRTEKDENCISSYSEIRTYKDADGNVLLVGETLEKHEEHHYQYDFELLGESCEDGVIITEYCADCDWSNSWEIAHHEVQETHYELRELGLCGGYIRVCSCPCGEEAWAEIEPWGCNWQGGGGENWANQKCMNCGATWDFAYEETQIDDCHSQTHYVHTFGLADGTEVLHLDYVEKHTNHRWEAELTLRDENGDCENGGFTAKLYCLECGATEEFGQYGHEVFPVDRQMVSEGELCGDVELVTTSCACGRNTETYLEWSNGECQFRYTGYGEEDDSYIYTCMNCGAVRYERNYHEPVEGNPCQSTHRWEYTYLLEGEELFVESGRYVNEEHNWNVETELMGESCEDGVIVRRICAECGEVEDEYTIYHHEAFSKHYDLGELGFCGGYVRVEGCACGEYIYTEIEPWGCDWTGMGDEGWTYHECLNCGGIWEIWWEETPIDECNGVRYDRNTFTLEDGTMVLDLESTWEYSSHDMNYQFTLLGDSCVDGVIIDETCDRCGYADSWQTYDHDWFELAHYDFADYGCCDGYLNIRGCACGEKVEVDYGSNCTWYGMGGFGGGITSFTETCDACGMQFTMDWGEQIVLDDCHLQKIYTFSFQKDDLDVTVRESRYMDDHREVYRLTLDHSDSCLDGYRVEEYCVDCGERIGSWGGMGSHEVFIVDRTPVELSVPTCGAVDQLTMSCACGEISYIAYEFDGCDIQEYWDEDRGEWVYGCVNCGIEERYQEVCEPVEGETCKEMVTATYTYLCNGEALLSYSYTEIQENHNRIASLELLNPDGTCDEGYMVTWYCQDCGHMDENQGGNVQYGCSTYRVAMEKLASKGELCGDYYLVTSSCACGAEGGSHTYWEDSSCSFQNVWDEEEQRWIYKCEICGVTRIYNENRTPIEGEVCQYWYEEHYTFIRDGVELFSYTINHKGTSHSSVAQMTLLNPEGTCDDGYTITWVCQDCGYLLSEDPEVYYGCETRTVQRIQLAGNGMLCGELYRVTERCACGKESNNHKSWSNGYCEFEHIGRNEEEQCEEYRCGKCGALRRDYYQYTEVEGLPCQEYYTQEDVYFSAEGDYLFTDTQEGLSHSPKWIFRYNLFGESCSDGYTRTLTCYYCGESLDEDEVRYGHETNTVEIQELVPESDTVCGPVHLQVRACACGENNYWDIDHNCSFSWVETGAAGEDIFRCNNCGLKRSELIISNREPFSCRETQTVTLVYFTEDGQEISRTERTFEIKAHQYIYDLTLAEGATSCDRGYYRSAHCMYCGYSRTEDQLYYGHERWTVEYYNLEDYGKCGGSVEKQSCACGENTRWESWISGGCNYSYTGEENEYGISERYCPDCNTYFYWDTRYDTDRENCRENTTMYVQLVRDGETLLDVVGSYESVSHTMLVMDYSGNCDDDYSDIYAHTQCYYCGAQGGYNWSGGGHHHMTVSHLPLESIGGCDGYVEQYICPCGEQSGLWWSDISCVWNYGYWEEQVIDGVFYYTQERVCENCGLKIVETYHDEESQELCRYNRIYTYEFWQGQTLEKVLQTVETYESHDHKLTGYRLLGENCEDGVVETWTCICGDSYESNSYSHQLYVDDSRSIDLAQYGSVCGETLQYSACACGRYQGYELVGECDIDTNYTPVWLEDALNEGQDTTEGWVTCYSYANTLTCAVTDPQCGLKIRMAGVWLAEDGCKAVQYEIWQLGYQETYDETTGETTCSWQQEIMIPTGEVRTHHNYEYTASNTLENGNGLVTNSYICSHCGSSYILEYTYLDHTQICYEYWLTNTLDDGKPKQKHYIRESDFTDSGYFYEKLEREEIVYADGSQWWSQTERSHVTDGGCKFIVRNTNSEGSGWEDVYEHYSTRNVWSWEEDSTCTQYGKEKREEVCMLCEELLNTEYYPEDPYGHAWHWDYTMDCYYCERCGLENSNGADGAVVVEDLTAQYGNDTDYVVGYWNRYGDNFNVYASVILDNITDGNDELVLSDIDFTFLTAEADGINALTTNRSAIQEAAKAAMADAGYTGSYAIRIAFVPADGDGTLDYAITFDSQTA